ncbi:PAS domain-containing sensor histidine kinase [Desertivirga arenae]|uniref:PAS domain-containing sensor histidine kinase n=1 Tax=Desertivirga arenae TaxID=2810309 RepID=UPI001A97447B|nr:PAS domain S-box protein [Pedobacter sp. SYSU D00823]
MGKSGNNIYRTSAPGMIRSALKFAPVPMAVLEGFDLVLTYANQALFKVWGKDKSIVGKQLLEILPELHDQPFPNQLKQVLLSGEVYEEDEAPSYVVKNGKVETIYFDYSYTPVRDDEGLVIGVLVVANDVTDRVEARANFEKSSIEAKQAQKKLEMTLGAGRMGYFEVDLNSGAITGTPQFRTTFGFDEEEDLTRETVMNRMLPKYRELVEEKLAFAFENKTVYTAQYEIVWPDGSLHWIKTTGYAVYKGSGEPITLCGVAIEVTREVQADEKRSILAAIIDSSDDTILSKTLDGIITSWNPAAQRMFGYTEEEIIGKHISTLIPHRLLSEEDHIIGNIKQGKKIDHFETTRLRKDGSEINIVLSVSPIRDRSGTIIGASKIARDITETKKVEEKQAILAAIVNSTDDTILSKTLQGIITSWNPAAERMFGYTEQEIIGKHISVLIPPEHLFEEDIIIGNIARGSKVDHFETVRVTKDGRRINISLTVSPLRDGNGNIIGASKIARDITPQKLAEKRLRNYAHTLETINELCKTISGELDVERLLQIVISAATRVTGANLGMIFYNSRDVNGDLSRMHSFSGQGSLVFDRMQEEGKLDALDQLIACDEVLRIDDIKKASLDNCRQFESLFEAINMVNFLLMPVTSKSGEVIGTILLADDEASKFNLEQEEIVLAIASQASIALENARLFEEVNVLNTKKDEFIGMASHELKTPLTSMSGYLQILERVQQKEEHKSFVQKTISQANKLSALVNDILDVSKIEAGKLQFLLQRFDLSALVLECIELIQLSNSSHKIDVTSPLPLVHLTGDRHRIEQVIINLLTNAIKYSPGAIKVKVLMEVNEEEVRVGVKDQGIGIASDKIPHLFSRFYRVEGLNPGMSGLGIGLYISKEIIERHFGRIWVESEEGEGSTFWFSLPLQGIA